MKSFEEFIKKADVNIIRQSNTPDDVMTSENIHCIIDKEIWSIKQSPRYKNFRKRLWIPLATHEKIVKECEDAWFKKYRYKADAETAAVKKCQELQQQITDLKGDLSTTFYWQQETAKKNQELLELKKSIAKAMEELKDKKYCTHNFAHSPLNPRDTCKHSKVDWSDVEEILKKVME